MVLAVMTDRKLCGQVASRLRCSGVLEHQMAARLAQVDRIAQFRLARLLPGLLTAGQWVELARLQGSATLDLQEWVRQQVPCYDELVRAVILDAVEEAIAI